MIYKGGAIDLDWWLHVIDDWNGSPLQMPPVDTHIRTDACNTGFGCVSIDVETY